MDLVHDLVHLAKLAASDLQTCIRVSRFEDFCTQRSPEGIFKIILPRPPRRTDHYNDEIQNSLLNDIESSLQTYLLTGLKPHYSLEQLAVIAVSFLPRCTETQALNWVLDHIPYYTKLALRDYARNAGSHSFRDCFKQCFGAFGVPLARSRSSTERFSIWWANTRAARIFLELHGRPQPDRPFRLMDLPAELRERIYGFALEFPTSDVIVSEEFVETAIRGRRRIPHVSVFSPKNKKADSFAEWMWELTPGAPQANFLQGPTLDKHLGLLLTSKHIYREAMPVFYKQTKFVCPSIQLLHVFLRGTPQYRRQHIRQLVFMLNPRHGTRNSGLLSSEWPSCFKFLKEMEGLQHLDIFMIEETWSDVETNKGRQKWPDVLKIPAVKQLGQLRGLRRVTFHGECPTVKAALEPLMILPKARPAPKKRNRSSQDEAGGREVAGWPKLKKLKKSAAPRAASY